MPIICGRNTGHHLYIDAGSGNSPTSLTFITTGSFERAFKMKITQIECGAVNRGVEGCLQYHTGVSGQISSFNYIGNKHCKGLECFQFRDCFTNTGFDCILSDLDEYLSEESEGLQLSNQEYSICVRHERGFCGISYTACEVRIDNHHNVFVSKSRDQDTDAFSISSAPGGDSAVMVSTASDFLERQSIHSWTDPLHHMQPKPVDT